MAVFCSNCGTAAAAGAGICSTCNMPIGVGAASAGAAPVASAAPTYAPQAAAQKGGNTLSTLAIVFGAISALFLPVLFGPVAIILAAIGKSKKESRSTVALIVAIGGLVVGMVFGFIVGYMNATN